MFNIRPVSDLRNKFTDIEDMVLRNNKPVFLTKNGYGSMVLLSLEQYEALYNNWEKELDMADSYAESTPIRLSSDEVFNSIRSRIDNVDKI